MNKVHIYVIRYSKFDSVKMPSNLLRVKTCCFVKSQLYSNFGKSFKEVSFPTSIGKIAGKWWGPTEIKPILCLHGIQDNCGTFNKLIPLILKPDISFLAFDLPGHGFSTSFPRGMLYNFMSYLILVEQIRKYFKWSTLTFMSHSFGAMLSFCYAILYPHNVKFLVCFDALQPSMSKVSAEVIRKSIDSFILYDDYKQEGDEPLAYTLDEMQKLMVNSYRSNIKPESAKILLERNIARSRKFPGKYYFTRDPILKVRNAYNWPQSQIVEDANNITHPIFVCEAKQISSPERKNFHEILSVLEKNSIDLDFHIVEGSHHVHLDEPEKLEPYITKFLRKHYKPEYYNLKGITCEFSESKAEAYDGSKLY